MDSNEPRIVERDGNIVRIVAGDIEVIAEMIRGPDEIVFNRLSIDGGGPGSVGFGRLRTLARQFARREGVGRIRIFGTTRTTGANPGKIPREIVIRV